LKFKEIEPGMVLWYAKNLNRTDKHPILGKPPVWANVFFLKRKHHKANLVWGYFITIEKNGLPTVQPEAETRVWKDRMKEFEMIPPEQFKVVVKGVFGDLR
jgi:hypothetical protein